MKVATIGINYPQTRLVLNAKVPGVQYCSYQNWFNPILKRIFHTYEIYKPIFQNKIDCYHTINTIMLTKKPWCCSFETMLPRGRQFLHLNHHENFDLKKGWYMEKLLNVLAEDNCKKIIAFSDCNYKLQELVYKEFPYLYESLMSKTTKFDVPQQLLIEYPKRDVNKDKIHFIFVGNDFVRKGVSEIVLAMYSLRHLRDDFDLTIVSKVGNIYNYAFNDFQDEKDDVRKILNIIESNKDWIKLYPHLSFDKVQMLMKKSDVGLLPTWAESYGYSVLEMQACGIPVISTNIRAMKEINKYGWIIDLPINYAGELGLKNIRQKDDVRTMMIDNLKNIMNKILDNRNKIIEKGISSFNYIKEVHSPALYTEKISKVYGLMK